MSLRVLVLAACVALVCGQCVNFCPDPIRGPGFFVCCDSHPGSCPPPRTSCPQASSGNSFPRRCHWDYECPRSQKCCDDICLRYKTCKPSVHF